MIEGASFGFGYVE